MTPTFQTFALFIVAAAFLICGFTIGYIACYRITYLRTKIVRIGGKMHGKARMNTLSDDQGICFVDDPRSLRPMLVIRAHAWNRLTLHVITPGASDDMIKEFVPEIEHYKPSFDV